MGNMTKPAPALRLIEVHAVKKLAQRHKTALAMPENILEAYSLNKPISMRPMVDGSRHKKYQNAQGYEFNRGPVPVSASLPW